MDLSHALREQLAMRSQHCPDYWICDTLPLSMVEKLVPASHYRKSIKCLPQYISTMKITYRLTLEFGFRLTECKCKLQLFFLFQLLVGLTNGRLDEDTIFCN